MTKEYQPINFKDKFTKFNETWTPKILTQFDDYYIKAAKMNGEFVWHSHDEVDELFIVVSGTLKIQLRDGEVSIGAGECFIVPKGTEHKPVAVPVQGCQIRLRSSSKGLRFWSRAVANRDLVRSMNLSPLSDQVNREFFLYLT